MHERHHALTALITTLALIFALLFFVVITEPEDCLPDELGADVPAEPVRLSNPSAALDVRVASWNTFARNSTGGVIRGLKAIAGAADVIGVQEMNPESRRSAVERAMAADGFAISAGNNSVQILWRASRYKLLAQGSEKVFDVERIETGVAGTSIGPKSVQWVQLQQVSTGAVFFVVNHHIVPSIENGRRPDDSKPKRIGLYQRQMAAMLSVVGKLRPYGPVAVTGDFNIDARADARVKDPRWPYVLMGSRGLSSNWRSLGYPADGTHGGGGRLIDYVWLTTGTAQPVQQRILGRYGSDHSAVVVAVTRSGAGGGNRPSSRLSVPAAATPPPPVAAATKAPARPASVPRVAGVSSEQMRVAQTVYTTVVAVGRAERWPAADVDHAAVITLSTAFKESDMLADPLSRRPDSNVDMGLFGQRTLPGWYGTPQQVLDPAYGTRAFLLGVKVTAEGVAAARRSGTQPAGAIGYQIPGLKQVDGWQRLSVSQAQHRVQRSAFPNMPPRLESLGQQLLAAFKRSIDPNAIPGAAPGDPADDPCAPTHAPLGDNRAGESGLDCPATQMAGERGLKPSALYALRCVADKFPQIDTIGGYYQTNAGEHPLYRAIDIMIPNYESAEGIALGNQISEWIKANAKPMNVMYVVWRKKIWNVQRDGEGWRQCGTAAAGCYAGPDPSAAHLNHVHVSVYPGEPPGFPKTAAGPGNGGAGSDIAAGGKAWIMPLAKGSYRVGCSISCYSGHTGQDFPAADGTNLASATAGTVVRSEALRDGGGGYRSYGNLIVIRPAGQSGMEIFYAHLSARDVQAGQTVTAGQHIGRTGNTGNSQGPHLHFEVRVGGSPRDPMPILRKQGVQP